MFRQYSLFSVRGEFVRLEALPISSASFYSIMPGLYLYVRIFLRPTDKLNDI